MTLETNHLFEGNPLSAQHKLRYESITKRNNWNVPFVRDMEYDNYDNPASYYLVNRNSFGRATGVSRLCSTSRPYMLEEHFPHLISKRPIPKDESIWETTRFCVDHNLPHNERKRILHKLVIAKLEFALDRDIKEIVAVTYPVLWRTIFIDSGWPAEWLGEVCKSDEGLKIVAGSLKVSQKTLANVRKTTGIKEKLIRYGQEKSVQQLTNRGAA
ncbi:MAG: hypothetical protein OEY94_05590 [Alphaproteobacteria bacterium]|nr:hypothetical protein [Alphaproteobacteria bacterium]